MSHSVFDAWQSYTVAADVSAATRADPEALAERQRHRLAALLRAAAQRSPLYRRMLQGRDPGRLQLEDLPVMRKAELMQRFDDWVADPALRLDALRRFTADRSRIAEPFLGRYLVWESSGSSGQPGIFVQDAAAMAVYDALEALRRPNLQPWRRMFDPCGLSERIVFVGALDGHFASTVSIERLRRMNPWLSGRLHSVSFLQPVERLVAEVQALAPTVIASYPSTAALLAGERMAGRLAAVPAEVWTGGENLSAATRGFIEAAFGCRVADSYGASEFLALAAECDQGRLHLNSDWAILEPVDGQGRAMPAGEAGATTLLTNLANHLQPLIRYDLGDRVRFRPGPCGCGSSLPVIEVQGRSDDTLLLGGPGKLTVALVPLALTTVLEEDAGLFDFQLVQRGPCELLLRTGLRGPAAGEALRRGRDALAAFLARHGATDVQIDCRHGVSLRCGASGKLPRVIIERAAGEAGG